MTTRRKFIGATIIAGASAATGFIPEIALASTSNTGTKPRVISTWKHGLAANEEAWKIISSNGKALDAVEQGVRVTENDLNNRSVGLGGLPDRDGHVTLDASIMDEQGRCGSVACLERIKNPISVARAVMDKTPHAMLVGEGAQKFAVDNGFKLESKKLNPESERLWKEWLVKSDYKPIINFENHDTIGMLAIDSNGNISGACTTSGLSYKLHGRVGDSPIIGAGLFVDNEVGGACATGLGESVIRICGSHLVVELMRQGLNPDTACKQAVERLMKKYPAYKDIQVGFLAINTKGEVGGYSLQKGFNYALADAEGNRMVESDSVLK